MIRQRADFTLLRGERLPAPVKLQRGDERRDKLHQLCTNIAGADAVSCKPTYRCVRHLSEIYSLDTSPEICYNTGMIEQQGEAYDNHTT